MRERMETDRLVLHRLNAEDMDLWLIGDRLRLESRTRARFPARLEAPPLCIGDMEAIRDLLHQHGDDPVWSTWLMVARNNDAAVGIAGFSRIEEIVEAGYSIYPALQRIGLATEGLNALIEWLFDHTDISALRAAISPNNTPSVRVAEKLGMRLVGTGEDLDTGSVLVYELIRAAPIAADTADE
jgi:RimJ/RimL family protein N-acetyltransferase